MVRVAATIVCPTGFCTGRWCFGAEIQTFPEARSSPAIEMPFSQCRMNLQVKLIAHLQASLLYPVFILRDPGREKALDLLRRITWGSG